MGTVYFTGKGDDGTTGILSSRRVSKADRLIEAIGAIDELNSSIGVAMAYIQDNGIRDRLAAVQNDLFVLGANLASTNEKKIYEAQIRDDAVAMLEKAIAEIGSKTPQVKSFVLPGGDAGAAHLHESRSIARRAERAVISAAAEYKVDRGVIAYLNRLSSYLFAAALYVNHLKGVEESHPTY
jgi:cob(I)alamin adenosyltransferase